jgi:uncharacterized protein (TIGR02646 family)
VIAIPRDRCPASLDGPESVGGKEHTKAVAYFSDPDNHDRKFPFAAYKQEDVKEALAEMFSGKCAYCESDVAAVGPADIEHYRPKSEITIGERRHKPGYYWLASDWENLVPSCNDCNRPRYQQTPAGPRLSGKGTRFPIVNEESRAATPGGEHGEEPYLLDPCRDEPNTHLEFLPEGAIRAALEPSGATSERGKVTIDTLGLDRSGLCNGRREHAIVVGRAMEHFRRASRRLDQNPDDPVAEAEVEEEARELARLTDHRTKYSAMARQLISSKLPDLEIS